MNKDQELRGWKAHCVELQGRVDRLELENSRLKDVIDAANAQEPSYFAREGGIAVSAEIREAGTYGQKELYCIPLYASPIPAQQSQAAEWINSHAKHPDTCDQVTSRYKKPCSCGLVEIMECKQSQAVAVTEDNAWIIEKLSYHKFERDDLSIDDCLKYLSSEWTEVAGRTTRQLVMQILYLLASSQLPRVTEREAKNG